MHIALVLGLILISMWALLPTIFRQNRKIELLKSQVDSGNELLLKAIDERTQAQVKAQEWEGLYDSLLKENQHYVLRMDELKNQADDRESLINTMRDKLTAMTRQLAMVLVLVSLTGVSLFAQPRVESIVTNGKLTPEKQFHMLVIHSGDAAAALLAQMIRQPRTAEMQSWANGFDVRLMNVNSAADAAFVREHHSDLVSQYQNELPIVAFVDRAGGVWWAAAGRQIPGNEKQLASVLSTYYSATLKAAAEQAKQTPVDRPALRQPSAPVQSGHLPSATVQNQPYFPNNGGSYFLDRGVAAPDAIKLPNLNVAVPQSVRASVQADANSAIMIIGAFAIGCALILAVSPVISSTIIAHAITEDHDQQ